MFIVYLSHQFADEQPPFTHENHADPSEISTELHNIPVSAPETLDDENVRVQLFLPGTPSIEASEVANSAYSVNSKSASCLRLKHQLHLHVRITSKGKQKLEAKN